MSQAAIADPDCPAVSEMRRHAWISEPGVRVCLQCRNKNFQVMRPVSIVVIEVGDQVTLREFKAAQARRDAPVRS
jgi:NADH pyrophosphatase NudC (nudix superfamily)